MNIKRGVVEVTLEQHEVESLLRILLEESDSGIVETLELTIDESVDLPTDFSMEGLAFTSGGRLVIRG